MSWQEAMRRMLQPVTETKPNATKVPDTTSPYGPRWREDQQRVENHPGADFDYKGGQALPLNRSHPAIRSPVTGIVTNAGEGDYGTIAIKDQNGLSHEILHTHRRHVAIGDPVVAGQLIGTMGNTGVRSRGVESGDHHVHYQIRDGRNTIDPIEFWDRQGTIDPRPPSPEHLNELLQYQNVLAARSDSLPDIGRRYSPKPVGSGAMQEQLLPPQAKGDIRILRSRPAHTPPVFGPQIDQASTVPNVLPNAVPAASFNDRFGSWAVANGVSAPLSPYQQLLPPPQTANPLGVINGQPMPDFPFPPPDVGDATPGSEAWSAFRRKPANWSKNE